MTERTFARREMLQLAAAGGAAGLLGLNNTPARAQTAAPPRSPLSPVSNGRRPNLILYFPDEMRADALGCYGNPVCKTPNYDRLAAQGTRFAECHVQYPVCGASRCSLLTGWPTSVHGHRSLYYFLRPDEPNLFRYLKQGGYDVFWFGKNDALAQQTFADSVTVWQGDEGQSNAGRNKGAAPDGPLTMLTKGGGDRRSGHDYDLLQSAIKILERSEQDRPFCIFLPLSNPHPPYRAPEGFDTMYKPGDLPTLVPPGLPDRPMFHEAIRKAYGLDKIGDAEFRQVRAAYYGQVSYQDWLLGELLEAIERTGHVNDTAIVAASDHGDYTGDYGLIEKWPSGMESCLTHVPLIGRMPGGVEGHVVGEMNELYDIMATFLDLSGIPAQHTHFARSLVPQLKGAAGDPNRAAFTEGGYNIYEPQAFEPKLGGNYAAKTGLQNDNPATISRVASVKTPEWNYVARPGAKGELYDRKKDPQERINLIDDKRHQATVHAMQVRLMDWYINTTGVPPRDKDSRGLPPFLPVTPFPDEKAKAAAILGS